MAIDPCSSGIQNQTLSIQVVNFQKAGCSLTTSCTSIYPFLECLHRPAEKTSD